MKRILAVLLCAGAAMACEGPAGEPGPAGAVTPSTDAFDVGQDETSFDAVAELFVDAPRNPDCDGKECDDDDCGGICGECQGGTVCDAGQCVCAPDCDDKECGDDDCGGICGECQGGTVCDAGQCVCAPDCDGKECGDDACGGLCGVCGDGESCQAGQCAGNDADETWTDPDSVMTWQVAPTPGGQMNWSDAKAHCAGLALDGGGWHLPTIGELRTLIRGCPATMPSGSCNVEEGDCLALSCADIYGSCNGCVPGDGPAANGQYLPDEVEGAFSDCDWSASVVEEDFYVGAWIVLFINGQVVATPTDLGAPLSAWCVR